MNELKDIGEVFLALEILIVFVVINVFSIGYLVTHAISKFEKRISGESE